MWRILLAFAALTLPVTGASEVVPIENGWERSGGRDGVWVQASVPPCLENNEGQHVWKRRLTAPAGWRDRHLRLRLLASPEPAAVFLDGERLSGAGNIFDLSPSLQAGREGQLTIRLDCVSSKPCGIVEAALLSTPRVFLAGESYRVSGKILEVTTTVRNTLENTANVDLHWELAFEGRVLATGASAATIPPQLSVDVPVRLTSPAPLARWGLHDPRLHTLRIIMVKNAEAIEGDSDMERKVALAVREVTRRSGGWIVNGEAVLLHAQTLPPCYPGRGTPIAFTDTPSEVVATHGWPVASWLREAADKAGVLIYQDVRAASTPKPRLRIISAHLDRGDSVIDVENPAGDGNYTLRRIQITVGHVSQTVRELRPGDRRTLRFEHVNPYRVEVKSASGTILLAR